MPLWDNVWHSRGGNMAQVNLEDALAAGREAVRRYAWREAFELLSAADVASSRISAGRRSARPATESLPRSTGRPAPSAAPSRSAIAFASPASRSEQAS